MSLPPENLQNPPSTVDDERCPSLTDLAYEENSMGRFLKDQGKLDKIKVGKMMIAVGKSMSYSGQQRLSIRTPLVRLYQEVETFHDRAIEDTEKTVKRMEKVSKDLWLWGVGIALR